MFPDNDSQAQRPSLKERVRSFFVSYRDWRPRLRAWVKRNKRNLWVSSGFLFLAFVTYLWILYRQVDTAFNAPTEFLPTRIYSDVTRLYPSLQKPYVENRLNNLRYGFQRAENSITFRLHQAQYPSFLLPDGNETPACMGEEVKLNFDGNALSTIECAGHQPTELFLEPELVTTLSRGGAGATTQIRDTVKFEDVPSHVWKAIIAIEDHHYLDHKGFDPRGLARAILVNLKTLSFAQGGARSPNSW